MIKSRYTVNFISDEGGSSTFYRLKESKTVGFKEFMNKKDAQFAYKTQKKLARFNLSPQVYSKLIRVHIEFKQDDCVWYEKTGWGFVTQIVKINKRLSRQKIQNLVESIYKKTKLKFWDCHEYNIGVYRNKYLCIDTGRESFDSDCNAWGMENPGPKCYECNKYTCKCGWGF